jgi:hypothetical protein
MDIDSGALDGMVLKEEVNNIEKLDILNRNQLIGIAKRSLFCILNKSGYFYC